MKDGIEYPERITLRLISKRAYLNYVIADGQMDRRIDYPGSDLRCASSTVS